MNIEDKQLLKVIEIIVNHIFPRRIFLFGSRSMDKADEDSDYDLFVVVDRGPDTRDMEKELYYLMAKAGIRIPVDLRVETQEAFDRLKSNRYLIYNQVAKYGKVLYEDQTTTPAVA